LPQLQEATRSPRGARRHEDELSLLPAALADTGGSSPRAQPQQNDAGLGWEHGSGERCFARCLFGRGRARCKLRSRGSGDSP
jgi:hypothetical protein